MKRLLFSYTYTNFEVLKPPNHKNALDMPCIILAQKKKGVESYAGCRAEKSRDHRPPIRNQHFSRRITMNSRDDAERLYRENKKLVHGALQRYFPTLAFDEDIQQIARIGLWKACLSYQEDRARFSTAAYKFIANEVRMELRRKSRPLTGA